jgi:hypothetical protein
MAWMPMRAHKMEKRAAKLSWTKKLAAKWIRVLMATKMIAEASPWWHLIARMVKRTRMLGVSLHLLSQCQGRGSTLNEALTASQAGCGLGSTCHEPMNSDQDHGSLLLPYCRLSPFCDEVLALFTYKQFMVCEWRYSVSAVIIVAVFCRAMLEPKTMSAAMCNEIGCICGISANSWLWIYCASLSDVRCCGSLQFNVQFMLFEWNCSFSAEF